MEIFLDSPRLRFTRGAVEFNIQRVISASLFLHPGFLIIDHIHFQYNGFMFGILLWSILMARNVRPLRTRRTNSLIPVCSGPQASQWFSFRRVTKFQAHLPISCSTSQYLDTTILETFTLSLASLLHIPSPIILLVPIVYAPSRSLLIVSERRHPDVPCIAWSIPTHGSTSSAPQPSFPVYPRLEPRVLGAECLGARNRS